MIRSAILPLLLIGSISQAAPLDEAQKVWKLFRACAKRTDSAPCAKEYIDLSLSPSLQGALIDFLDKGMVFSALQECTENSPVTPAKVAPKEVYFCMELPNLKKPAHGYVMFSRKDEALKIRAIKFKL